MPLGSPLMILGVVRTLLLAEDEVEGEAVNQVVEGDPFPLAGRVCQFMDLGCIRERLGGTLEVGFGFNYKSDAAKGVGIRLSGAVYEWVGRVATVVDLIAPDTLRHREAEVEQELVRFVEVDVRVVDVGGADKADLFQGGLRWHSLKSLETRGGEL